jgi:hypothetical protein
MSTPATRARGYEPEDFAERNAGLFRLRQNWNGRSFLEVRNLREFSRSEHDAEDSGTRSIR